MDHRLSLAQRQHQKENTLSSYLQLMVLSNYAGIEPDGKEYLHYLYNDLCEIAPIVGEGDLSYVSYPSSYQGTISQIRSYHGYPVVVQLTATENVTDQITDVSLRVAVFTSELTGDPNKDLFSRMSIDHNHWVSSHLSILRSSDESPNRIMSNFIYNRWRAEYSLQKSEIPYTSGVALLEEIIDADLPAVKSFIDKFIQ